MSQLRRDSAVLSFATTEQTCYRAVFEGVAFSIAEAADALPEFVDSPAVYLAGGGSLHQTWRQLLCDLLGKRLLVVENPNASAQGAAILGGDAAGFAATGRTVPASVDELEPDSRTHTSLSLAFERWKEVASRYLGHSALPGAELTD